MRYQQRGCPHNETKHIDVNFHHVDILRQNRIVEPNQNELRNQLADMLTKTIRYDLLEKHRGALMYEKEKNH